MTRPANQQFRLGRRPNHARNARVAELYMAGLSSVEVGKRVGMTSASALNVLRRMGVPLRSLAEAQRLAKRRTARRKRIAEAAQRRFGHLRAPGVVERDIKPSNVPRVNPGFEDDVLDQTWEDWP